MTPRSTATRRHLRVDETTVVTSIPLPNVSPCLVYPPFTCEPGRDYIVELDLATHTATITPAQEATHEH